VLGVPSDVARPFTEPNSNHGAGGDNGKQFINIDCKSDRTKAKTSISICACRAGVLLHAAVIDRPGASAQGARQILNPTAAYALPATIKIITWAHCSCFARRRRTNAYIRMNMCQPHACEHNISMHACHRCCCKMLVGPRRLGTRSGRRGARPWRNMPSSAILNLKVYTAWKRPSRCVRFSVAPQVGMHLEKGIETSS